MKIRTFMVMENLEVDEKDSRKFTVTNMLGGIVPKSLPAKESVVLLLTFDEVEDRPKDLEVLLLDPKDKPVSRWDKEMEPNRTVVGVVMAATYNIEGIHHIKISYNGIFLGKFPFNVSIKKGGGQNGG